MTFNHRSLIASNSSYACRVIYLESWAHDPKVSNLLASTEKQIKGFTQAKKVWYMIISVMLRVMYLMCFVSSSIVIVGLGLITCSRVLWSSRNLRLLFFINNLFVCDEVSTRLIVLSMFITLMSMLSSGKVKRDKMFKIVLISRLMFLMFSFIRRRFFFFFFFFEAVLVPFGVLIVGWGKQPERLQACTYIVIYTLRGSLMFLLGLRNMIKEGMRDYVFFIGRRVNKTPCQLWWLFFLGFIVKLPIYPLHLWLPKAHVEAPVAGSMLLAGVVLKLGGYGIMRFIKVVEVCNSLWRFWVVLSINIIGGFYASLACFRQVDLKCLVAYSSVSHISLVLLGLMRNCLVGVIGGFLIIIGHGLCSSGLFRLINVLYKNSNSRLLILNKGYLLSSPFISIAIFLLRSSNIAAPPSLNLLGEIIIFVASGCLRVYFLIIVILLRFVRACYRLLIYCRCVHGKAIGFLVSQYWNRASDLLVAQCHWLPLNFLFLFPIF